MIIIRLSGGLGNQLFQYAFGKSMSVKFNHKLILDATGYTRTQKHIKFIKTSAWNIELKNLEIDTQVEFNTNSLPFYEKDYYSKVINNIMFGVAGLAKRLNNYHIVEKHQLCYDKSIKLPSNNSRVYYYEGVWASYKYFQNIRNVLIKDIQSKNSIGSRNKLLIKQMQLNNSVSLHIRRGDYINNQGKFGVLPVSYYEKCFKYIQDNISNPVYYIFSDDIEWCKKNLIFLRNSNVQYINHNNGERSYIDMLLMSTCKHNIIANSTFSWRGARLNRNTDNIIIAPSKPFKSYSYYEDFYPVGRRFID